MAITVCRYSTSSSINTSTSTSINVLVGTCMEHLPLPTHHPGIRVITNRIEFLLPGMAVTWQSIATQSPTRIDMF